MATEPATDVALIDMPEGGPLMDIGVGELDRGLGVPMKGGALVATVFCKQTDTDKGSATERVSPCACKTYRFVFSWAFASGLFASAV